MKNLLVLLVFFLMLISRPAVAQECGVGNRCISEEDLKALITVTKEKQCLLNTQPAIDLDPVVLTIDRDGRVFFTGAEPKPYTLRMKWCNFDLQAKGKVNVVAAMQEPPEWGFRFRPKAYLGFLPGEALRKDGTAKSAVDAGLMLDPFYYKFLNLNVHVGFRAVGVGIGVDIFRSFGVYGGYAATWDGFRSNGELSTWFSFW